MISISGLTKHYGDRTLFADVSLQLNPGERYGLVGANGSGKTTLLNIMSGLEDASAGSVEEVACCARTSSCTRMSGFSMSP